MKRAFNINIFLYLSVYSFLILLVFNIQSVLDFLNISIMYLPLFFIIFISNHNTEIIEVGMIEIYFIQNKSQVYSFFKDVFLTLLNICIMLLMNLAFYKILYIDNFNFAISIAHYFAYTFTSILFFTSFAYLFSTLTFNKSASIFFLSIFWLIFIVNVESRIFFNPFYFVGDPNSPLFYMLVQLGISIMALFLTGYLKTKSPYILQRIRKY